MIGEGGAAAVNGLKRHPSHVCVCSGGIARVECKRPSVLVMPSCFFPLLSMYAPFKCCQANESTTEQVFLFKKSLILIQTLYKEKRNDDH